MPHPPLQHLLYEISNFVYDAAHLSYENRLESCGVSQQIKFIYYRRFAAN